MRLRFDEKKSRGVKRKHGISLKEAQEIFDQVYLVDKKRGDPEQFRAIGWCRGRLCSVIFEIRTDSDGEYYHLITAWKPLKRSSEVMSKISKPPTADQIAQKASRGEDVSRFFDNKFTIVRPVHRVNVDLTEGMLRKVDERAAQLNISRQAVIKTLLERSLLQERRSPRKKKAS